KSNLHVPFKMWRVNSTGAQTAASPAKTFRGGYLNPMSRTVYALCSVALSLIFFSTALAQSSITTTAVDRRAVNITVYNSNIGLVRETRSLVLPQGRIALRFADVSAQIRPETVH